MISVPYYPTIGGPFTELEDGLCNRGTRIFGCKKMTVKKLYVLLKTHIFDGTKIFDGKKQLYLMV